MSTPTDTLPDLDLTVLHHLDWVFRPACEMSIHPTHHDAAQSAMFLVQTFHACTPDVGQQLLLCLSGWELLAKTGGRCHRCKARHIPREDCMRILHVIGGAH